MSRRWLIAVSMSAHVAVGSAVFVSGIWRMERLHADPLHNELVLQPPPPAPSGGPKAVAALDFEHKKHREIPKVPVQPEPPRVEPKPPVTGTDDPPGPGNGSGTRTDTGTCTENCGPAVAATPVCGDGSVDAGEACDDGNTASGDGCSATCQAEPRPELRQPTTLSPTVLQGLRVAGETQLHPSTTTQTLMLRDGTSRVEAIVKVCLGTDGNVASAKLLKSTKYDDYDATLLSAVRSWRYQPYLLNGTPVPACSTVSFHYTMK